MGLLDATGTAGFSGVCGGGGGLLVSGSGGNGGEGGIVSGGGAGLGMFCSGGGRGGNAKLLFWFCKLFNWLLRLRLRFFFAAPLVKELFCCKLPFGRLPGRLNLKEFICLGVFRRGGFEMCGELLMFGNEGPGGRGGTNLLLFSDLFSIICCCTWW